MRKVAIGLIGAGVFLMVSAIGIMAGRDQRAAVVSQPEASPSLESSQSPLATPEPTSTPASAKGSCGDPASGSDAVWYGVFVDGGNLEEIRSKFCRDAIAVTREKSGKPSIQVASFIDRARAESFAQIVGGEASEYDPNLRESAIAISEPSEKQTPAYESLDRAFLEVQERTPGLPDTPALRRMIGNLAMSYCENRKQGFSDSELLNQAIKSIGQLDSTDEMKMMASALAGTIIYAAKTHLCPH